MFFFSIQKATKKKKWGGDGALFDSYIQRQAEIEKCTWRVASKPPETYQSWQQTCHYTLTHSLSSI